MGTLALEPGAAGTIRGDFPPQCLVLEIGAQLAHGRKVFSKLDRMALVTRLWGKHWLGKAGPAHCRSGLVNDAMREACLQQGGAPSRFVVASVFHQPGAAGRLEA